MKCKLIVSTLVISASLCGQSFGIDLLSRMLGGRGSGCDSSCCDTAVVDPSCGCESASPCGSGCGIGKLGLFKGPSCGCEAPSACGCAAPAPSCGCEAPACGSGCASTPSCGCEAPVSCCKPVKKPLQNLLKKVKCSLPKLSIERSCCAPACDTGCSPCASAAPSCGCEAPACGNGCASAAPSCGCEAPACGNGCASAAPSCGCEAPACGGCAAAPSCGCESPCDPCKKGMKLSLSISRPNLLGKLFKRNACCDSVGCDSCTAAPSTGCSSCSSSSTPVSAPAASGEYAPVPPAPVVDPSAYLNSKRRVIQTSFVR